jgi:tRNA-dihydrouridine synthase
MRSGFADASGFEQRLAAVAAAGVSLVTLHPRTRQQGYSGHADWGRVAQAARLLPVPVVGSGDLTSAERALAAAAQSGCHGVMLGRAAYQNPILLTDVDARFFGGAPTDLDAAIATYCNHVEHQLAQGARLHTLIKPMLGLYNGRPGARLFRRHLSENAPRHDAGIAVLRDALDFVRQREAA